MGDHRNDKATDEDWRRLTLLIGKVEKFFAQYFFLPSDPSTEVYPRTTV